MYLNDRIKISVIIPTIDRSYQLKNCLQSLFNQSILPDEIVIVDNSSTQKARRSVKNLYIPKKITINYIWEKRTGVAYARNTGIRASQYDLVSFIDDDCQADKHWVKNILSTFHKYPESIIQGKTLNGFPDNIFSCTEHFTTESFFQSQRYGKKTKFLDTKNLAFNKLLFKKPLYFDTRFTTCYEDVDISIRIRNKGINILYQPTIKVWHYGRIDFFNHMKREFNKGKDLYNFQKKWQKNISGNYRSDKFIGDYVQNKKNNIENQFKEEILAGKSFLFKINFYLLMYFDRLLMKLGFIYKSLYSLYG